MTDLERRLCRNRDTLMVALRVSQATVDGQAGRIKELEADLAQAREANNSHKTCSTQCIALADAKMQLEFRRYELAQAVKDRAELLERVGRIESAKDKKCDECEVGFEHSQATCWAELAQVREQLAAAVKINVANQGHCAGCVRDAQAAKYRELLNAVPRGFACDEETMHKLLLERVKSKVGPKAREIVGKLAKIDYFSDGLSDTSTWDYGTNITVGDLRALKREMEGKGVKQ